MRTSIRSFECEICKKGNESRKHTLDCEKLNERYENNNEFEDMFHGNIKKKVEIARCYIQNLKTREKLRQTS